MPIPKFATTRRKIASLVLGSAALPANTKTAVDMTKIPPFVQVGMRSVMMKLEFKLTATFTEPASQPLLQTLYLKSLLDTELVGPAGFIITAARKGWHDPIWEYMQRGRIDWIKGINLPAAGTAATRTWTQEIDFEEPLTSSPLARCWPVEAFKAGGAGLFVTYKTPYTIKGVALTTTSLTLDIYAHVFDVKASEVPIPILVSELAVKTNGGDINPSPGIGQYLRILMSLAPVPADNDGTASDDLSAYTTIDYFGLQNAYAVYQQPVPLYMQDLNKQIATEQPSQLNVNTGNQSEFRLLDPQQNFDGAIRAIPLVYPQKGSNIFNGPIYNDFPRLGANGDVTAGLPLNFWWLLQRLEPRTQAVFNATVGAMTSVSTNRSLLGANGKIPSGLVGQADVSRLPMIVDAS